MNTIAFNKMEFDELLTLTKANDSLSSEKKLLSVGKIIRDHGYENEIGLCLLHRHFDLNENETLVESLIDGALVLQPVNLNSPNDVWPYAWKFSFDQQSKEFVLIPLEFTSEKTSSILKVCEFIMRDEEFLNEVADCLKSHDFLGVIGLASLHQVELLLGSEDGLLEEFTDPITRSHILKRVSYNQDLVNESINTLWRFDLQGVKGCNKLCRRNEWHC